MEGEVCFNGLYFVCLCLNQIRKINSFQMESIDIEYLLYFFICVKCGWNKKVLNLYVSVLKF